jgi:hypothetical protein
MSSSHRHASLRPQEACYQQSCTSPMWLAFGGHGLFWKRAGRLLKFERYPVGKEQGTRIGRGETVVSGQSMAGMVMTGSSALTRYTKVQGTNRCSWRAGSRGPIKSTGCPLHVYWQWLKSHQGGCRRLAGRIHAPQDRQTPGRDALLQVR